MTELTDWMDRIGATAVRYALARDYHPKAHLLYADGRYERVPLEGGGGDHARDLRSLAVVRDPAMIALITEVWTARPDLTLDDPDVRRLAMGELSGPSQLPRNKRGEALLLYAEAAATGEHHVRFWDIFSDARGHRIRVDQMDQPEPGANRFWPVFVIDRLLEEIERGVPGPDLPEHILSMLRQVGDTMPAEEKRLRARRALALMLIAGAGDTSRQFERESSALTRKAIEWIVQKGGPARTGT